MTKKFLILFTFCISLITKAQLNTVSPYSVYGYGKKTNISSIANMLGLSAVHSDIRGVNFENPATYSHLKFVNYSFGVQGSNLFLKSSQGQESLSKFGFSNISVAFPMGNFGIALGYYPMSFRGYHIKKTAIENGDENTYVYKGKGGLNKAFLGMSYRYKGFSTGVNTSYIFGRYNKEMIYERKNLTYFTAKDQRIKIDGMGVDLGIYYTYIIKENYTIDFGATYRLETRLYGANEHQKYSFKYTSNGIKTSILMVDEKKDANYKTQIPTSLSLGIRVGKFMNWNLGVQYNLEQMENFIPKSNIYTNAHKFNLGGTYIPNAMSLDSYLETITYIFGVYFEQSALKINKEQINDYGLNLGLSLPMNKKGLSTLDLGINVGIFGTDQNSLLQETYVKFSLQLSLSDKWFIERKYY